MEIKEKKFDNEIFYYIDEFDFEFGKVYKFSSLNNDIYCSMRNGEYEKIKNKKQLRIIKEQLEIPKTHIIY